MNRVTTGLLTVLLAGTTACVEDPTALDGPPLSVEELRLLGLELAATTLEARLEAGVDADAPGGGGGASVGGVSGLAPVTVNREASGSRPCALGGALNVTASAQGSYDDVTRVGAIAFHIVADPDDCRRQRDGFVVELNGWPDLVADLEFTRNAIGVLRLAGSIEGGILVARDDRNGSGICIVDLTLEAAVDAGQTSTLPVKVTGTLCGAPIETTRSLDF